MNKYADLHLHISLKHYVNKKSSIWEREKYSPFWDKAKRSTAQNYDQSDVTTLIESNVKLAVIALHPAEKIVSKSWFNQFIGKKFFGFKPKNVRGLYDDNTSYFSVLNYELDYISKKGNQYQKVLQHGDNKAIIVQKQEDLEDENETKFVLSIEGAHALAESSLYTAYRDYRAFTQEIINNLNYVKSSWPFPVFSITLSHFTYNFLSGQCWAIPLPGLIRFTNFKGFEDLFAKNQAITPAGFEFIAKALTKTDSEYRILIDVKHTHIVSRYQYYQYLKDNNLWGEVPIITSHTGVSGRKDFYNAYYVHPVNKIEDRDDYQYFNPWEINICDEEIKMIIESNGIIGISLDQRILGAGNNDFVRNIKVNLQLKGVKKWKKLCQTSMFFANVAHIVKVGGKKAWDHICIGSDFDGIIDPLDVCPTANYLPILEKMVVENVDKIYLGDDYQADLHLDNSFTISDAMRKVFYLNQRDFVYNNFPVKSSNSVG